MSKNRIDVHQHVVPPFWAEELIEKSRNIGDLRPPAWSPESAIRFMDECEIETGILSLTPPGVLAWPGHERAGIARRVNEYVANLSAQSPKRFGNFVTLPLPDIDGALAELTYAYDSLQADGVILFSNYEDRYLGDPHFDQIWAELDRRAAVVFIHPTMTTLRDLPGIPGPFVDFPFDTTRTAVDIVLKGVFDRYKNMKVILSHAGGFVPYAAYRFSGCASYYLPEPPEEEKVLANFRRFYFDTALSSSPAALPSLKAFADPTHILYGSDYPYAREGMSKHFTHMLDTSPLLADSEHSAINNGNAQSLFPRLSV